MRRFRCVLIAVVVAFECQTVAENNVLPAALAGPRDVNHVANPGFEDHADGNVRGWSRYGEGYELVREGRDGGWCVRCRSATDRPDVPRYAPCWWPDPLLPVRNFDVDPGWAQPLWITVYVPGDTPPRAYTGTVTISADGNPDATVPLSLRVHDFILPVRGHLKTAFALMQGYLEKVYGAEKVSPKLRQAYGDYLLAHRLNPDDITRTDLPHLEDIAHYRDCGLNAFNVLNMVPPREEAPWRCWSPLESYTPEFKQNLIARLDPFVAALKARGLAESAYVYSFDERPAEFNPILREYFGLIKQRYGLPTLTTSISGPWE